MKRNRLLYALRPLAAPALALALIGAVAPSVRADDDDRAATAEEIEKVKAALTGKGYTDVHDIEVDDGRFEVDATHPDGYRVDLELDLQTLEILYEKRDD